MVETSQTPPHVDSQPDSVPEKNEYAEHVKPIDEGIFRRVAAGIASKYEADLMKLHDYQSRPDIGTWQESDEGRRLLQANITARAVREEVLEELGQGVLVQAAIKRYNRRIGSHLRISKDIPDIP